MLDRQYKTSVRRYTTAPRNKSDGSDLLPSGTVSVPVSYCRTEAFTELRHPGVAHILTKLRPAVSLEFVGKQSTFVGLLHQKGEPMFDRLAAEFTRQLEYLQYFGV